MMWKIGIWLKNLNLLTVGSAYPITGVADITTITVKGRVIIPGSSFKGILRTAAHRASKRIGMSSCGEIEPGKIQEAHTKIRKVCDVCKVFGRPGIPIKSKSKIRVTDLIPEKDIRPTVFTRTSIDAKTGKVIEGALFSQQVIPLCTTFRGSIEVSDKESLKLVLAALEELRRGVIGKGSLVDVKVEVEPHPNSEVIGEDGMKVLSSLRDWRWDICK